MARVLHLLKAEDPALALEMAARQRADGDDVALALLPGAGAGIPAGLPVHRVPDDWSWDTLLEQIFAAEQVITW